LAMQAWRARLTLRRHWRSSSPRCTGQRRTGDGETLPTKGEATEYCSPPGIGPIDEAMWGRRFDKRHLCTIYARYPESLLQTPPIFKIVGKCNSKSQSRDPMLLLVSWGELLPSTVRRSARAGPTTQSSADSVDVGIRWCVGAARSLHCICVDLQYNTRRVAGPTRIAI
jgi:hypothetical protein